MKRSKPLFGLSAERPFFKVASGMWQRWITAIGCRIQDPMCGGFWRGRRWASIPVWIGSGGAVASFHGFCSVSFDDVRPAVYEEVRLCR